MLADGDIDAAATTLRWAAFGVACAFGAISQRTQFCTMGALSDAVHVGDWRRLRMWVLAIAVAILGFNALVAFGVLAAGESVYANPRLLWLSHLVGGAMFGVGMVLASGCGAKTLVRVGGGNLKSLVVLLVLGATAFATLKGVTAVLRVDTVDAVGVTLPSTQELPALLAWATGWSATAVAGWLGGVLGLGLIAWVCARREGREVDVLLGGIGIGACVVAVWWLSGGPGFVPEHPATLEAVFLATNSRHMESLSFVAPVGYALDWLVLYSDANKVLTIGIVACAGVVVGSWAMAILGKSFRWEGFGGVEDLANHLGGAALMGVGGVTALGCTIGQGISGVSTLSVGSFITLAAIGAGAFAALNYQAWRVERMAG